MHEFGVADSLLKAVLHSAEQNQATRVIKVRMRIGPLSGIVIESLQFAFEALAQDTIAENADLEIDETRIVCYCSECDQEFDAGLGQYRCPRCGKPSGNLRSGRELDVLDMEVA
ncbi:MAG: hydrogenase maturation nickel metallochaperone HypA [Kiritimatiellae bacterium]|nr:hydrogenase maturation nickel metallochaperone HypA [Kiritimatiellia bacterium]